MTPELIGIIALAAVLLTANYRQGQISEKRHEQLVHQVNQHIDQLRQQVNQQGQQINQLTQQMGHLTGLLEDLRGRPLPETEV